MINSGWSRSACAGGLLIGLLSLFPRPLARANPIPPPPVILTHVQEYGADPCESPVTTCSEIVRNMPDAGEFLFQSFVHCDCGYAELRSVTATVEIPENWWIYDVSACQGGTLAWNWLPDGSAIVVQVDWPDCVVIPYRLLHAFTLDVWVDGPGEIRFREDTAELRWGCPISYPEPVFAVGAVAGADCAYTNYMCGEEEHCVARFDEPWWWIWLVAPLGGSDQSEVPFTSDRSGCAYWLDTHAAWLSGSVRAAEQPGGYVLDLVADATGLPEGIYRTLVQVGDAMSARCLQVALQVQGTSSVGDLPVREERSTWGHIKSAYRD